MDESILRILQNGEPYVDQPEQIVGAQVPLLRELMRCCAALIFDSVHRYRAPFGYIRVVEWTFRKGDVIRSMAATVADRRHRLLHAGHDRRDQLGRARSATSSPASRRYRLRVGDTVTTRPRRHRSHSRATGRSSRWCSAACSRSTRTTTRTCATRWTSSRSTTRRLMWEPETSDALGFGFRCGFLGLLHMDIVRERLEREYDLELMATMPSVEFEVDAHRRRRVIDGPQPDRHARPGRIAEMREPYVGARSSRRRSTSARSWSSARSAAASTGHALPRRPSACSCSYDLPLAEIVLDFFDQLKSRTRGYASLDYEPARPAPVQPRQARRAARRRPGRRALDGRAPRQGLRASARC